jgi:hypothetical protein
MNWIVAGLIAGVAAWIADFVMWSKVFTKGMEPYATPPAPGTAVAMGPMMVKSASLALVFGVFLALVYRQFMTALWTAPGALGGMELATTLWVPVALAALGTNVWFDRTRTLLTAQLWSWLVRVNVAGLAVGLLMR